MTNAQAATAQPNPLSSMEIFLFRSVNTGSDSLTFKWTIWAKNKLARAPEGFKKNEEASLTAQLWKVKSLGHLIVGLLSLIDLGHTCTLSNEKYFNWSSWLAMKCKAEPAGHWHCPGWKSEVISNLTGLGVFFCPAFYLHMLCLFLSAKSLSSSAD